MPKKVATRAAYGKALVKLGEVNPDVVVLDADLAKSTKTDEFAARFPGRFFDMGIAEADMMGTAAGLAAAGKIPFASTFAVFAAGRAFDQVRQVIGYTGLNVKICATHGGITVGEDGASHQSVEDIALMRAIPGMTVIVPADAVETEKAVFAAARHKGPVYIRLGRSGVPVIFDEGYSFEIGRAAVLREGGDVTFIACGALVSSCLEAASRLATESGVSARVLNMATIKPADCDAVIAAARDTGAIVTAEEHSVIGGLGSAVCEITAEGCPVPVERVGIRDVFGQSGTAEELLEAYGLLAEDIVKAALRAIQRKHRTGRETDLRR
ncbi:MAG: transketolase family protein [Firmicutes bacterium]|nr:transketolase family protein [Bacillota bacterium]MDH7495256.1 transketolase family protein [Bacillota bacterium]